MAEKNIDKRKESLLNRVKDCVNKLVELKYGMNMIHTVMPLFYILIAHRHGMRFATKSPEFNKDHFLQMPLNKEFDSDIESLLHNISRYFPNLIWREVSHCIADFYEENNFLFKEYYPDIIEYLISQIITLGGRNSSEFTTPSYLIDLLQKIILSQKTKGVYDPCAGLCTMATIPEMQKVKFEGIELNKDMHLLASIRMDAYNRPLSLICGDALSDWDFQTSCECLCSDLPMGVKVSSLGKRQTFLEDKVISNFINTNCLKRAVLVVSMSSCSRIGNQFERELLCEKNYIEAVVELPNGVLSYTGVKSVILVLQKNRNTDKIKFVSASDCLIKDENHQKTLDVETIMRRIDGNDCSQVSVNKVKDVVLNNCYLEPSRYINEEVTILPGQKLVPMDQIASFYKGDYRFDETEGRVLKREFLFNSLSEFKLNEHVLNIEKLDSNDHYIKLTEACVIFSHSLGWFFIKYDKLPLFISSNVFFPFVVDSSVCSMEYFVLLMQNRQVVDLFKGSVMPHIDEKSMHRMLIPIFEDKETQENLVERAYREVEKELRAKIEKLQILGGKSSDLLHNLGITFTRMGSAVSVLQKNLHHKAQNRNIDLPHEMNLISNARPIRRDNFNDEKGEIQSSVESLDDNIKYALRQINSTGTDFANVTPDLRIVDIEEVIEKYMVSWDNFGYGSFKLLPLSSKIGFWHSIRVKVDIAMLYTMLDCILTNAHQHGFNRKADDRNLVSIELKPVIFFKTNHDDDSEEGKYILLRVSNNGNPLPEGFTLNDFATRGVVGINSSQDGLGGDHICKIAHHFGGKISMESSEQWVSFHVLIPIYVNPENTKFTEYENECI